MRKQEDARKFHVMRITGTEKNHTLRSFINYSISGGKRFLFTTCKE
jgi:hypothetical protein